MDQSNQENDEQTQIYSVPEEEQSPGDLEKIQNDHQIEGSQGSAHDPVNWPEDIPSNQLAIKPFGSIFKTKGDAYAAASSGLSDKTIILHHFLGLPKGTEKRNLRLVIKYRRLFPLVGLPIKEAMAYIAESIGSRSIDVKPGRGFYPTYLTKMVNGDGGFEDMEDFMGSESEDE